MRAKALADIRERAQARRHLEGVDEPTSTRHSTSQHGLSGCVQPIAM